MKRIFISVVATLALTIAAVSPAKAQDPKPDFGGTMINNDIATWLDLYDMSFTSHNFGTARSMAMGNAFTALGADMVSSSLNPAGVGMYVGGDFSFSPMMSFSKSRTEGGDPYYSSFDYGWFDDHTERFAIPSFGVVSPIYMGTGGVTNINFGISYNRIADFNQERLMASYDNDVVNSMANYFCELANANRGDFIFDDDSGRLLFGDPHFWGSVLAYKNGLINVDDQGWFIDRIGTNALVDHYSAVQTKGSLGEWAFTAGFNIVDKLYLGISLGIQDLNYKRRTYSGENYHYGEGEQPNISDKPLDYEMQYANYIQNTRYSGAGHNFKIGVTARPFNWLRIGVAYHTPTYYSIDLSYSAEMNSETFSAGDNPDGYTGIGPNGYFEDYVESPLWEDYGAYSWDFRSPSRLLTGVALTIGRRAIISVDYERSWYQTIRLQDSPIEQLDVIYKQNYKDIFKGSNTLRLGAELYILPAVALRAGYIWSGKTLRSDYEHAIFTRPIPTEQSLLTAGFGLHLNKTTTLDFAYQYGQTHYTAEQIFYVTETVGGITEPVIESAVFNTKTDRHHAVVTIGFRF
ncbi:MAG: outer membrane protein transport protein [Alistipes sp.]|nr:outer membrane protein transport protein [Alistipes sp.]